MAFDTPVLSVMDKHGQLEHSVASRLKWAGGANPALNTVIKEFDDMISTKDVIVQVVFNCLSLRLAWHKFCRHLRLFNDTFTWNP